MSDEKKTGVTPENETENTAPVPEKKDKGVPGKYLVRLIVVLAAVCVVIAALLATVMTKMNRCPYGITKPICDRCDRPCFGTKQTHDFLQIMNSTSTSMFLRHPIMAFKHKLASMGVDYAKYQQQKKVDDKAKAKEKSKDKKDKK